MDIRIGLVVDLKIGCGGPWEKVSVFFFFGTYLFSVHFFVFIKDIILSNFYVKCAKKKLKFNLFWNAKKLDLKKHWDRKWKTKPFPTILTSPWSVAWILSQAHKAQSGPIRS